MKAFSRLYNKIKRRLKVYKRKYLYPKWRAERIGLHYIKQIHSKMDDNTYIILAGPGLGDVIFSMAYSSELRKLSPPPAKQ